MPLAIWNVSGDSAVIAAVAAFAALVAALTAQYRLKAQLTHDSQMRERDATRDALDGVVNEITAAAKPMIHAGEVFRELFRVRAATAKTIQDHGVVEAEKEARSAVEALRARRAPLMAASFRLHLRFPDSEPIIGLLSRWRDTFDELADHYEAALDAGEFERKERFETAEETSSRLGTQLNEFLTEARAWASNPPH
jgi:hypothetical protein